MSQIIEEEIKGIVDLIISDYEDERTVNKIDVNNQPDKQAVVYIVDKLLKILYPGYYSDKVYKVYTVKNNMAATIEDVIFNLKKQIAIVLKYSGASETDVKLDDQAEKITLEFMKKIPAIRQV